MRFEHLPGEVLLMKQETMGSERPDHVHCTDRQHRSRRLPQTLVIFPIKEATVVKSRLLMQVHALLVGHGAQVVMRVFGNQH